jgi:lysozyme
VSLTRSPYLRYASFKKTSNNLSSRFTTLLYIPGPATGMTTPNQPKRKGIMHRFTSDDGIELIKSFESFSPTTYICPAGKVTIGYGHVLRAGEGYQGISGDMAERLLKEDLLVAESSVLRNIQSPLEKGQFDALVSLTYNIGGGNLQRSTLRQKINYGASTEEVRHEFMKWVYASGKVLAGLVRRRVAESDMFCMA